MRAGATEEGKEFWAKQLQFSGELAMPMPSLVHTSTVLWPVVVVLCGGRNTRVRADEC